MLDHFSVSHKGGIVLWSRCFTPAAAQFTSSAASPVNSLMREAIVEGRNSEEKFEKDGYAVRWSFVNDLELVFVVAYQRILQLKYVEDLLAAAASLFVKLFEPIIRSFIASLHLTTTVSQSGNSDSSNWDFIELLKGWDEIFDKLLRGLEDKASESRRAQPRNQPAATVPTNDSGPEDSDTAPPQAQSDGLDVSDTTRNIQALMNRSRGRGGKRGRSRNDPGSGRERDTGSDSDTTTRKKGAPKTLRKWADSALTESEMEALDYSAPGSAPDVSNSTHIQSLVDEHSLGERDRNGLYEVKDWEFTRSKDIDDAITQAIQATSAKDAATPAAASSTSLGAVGSLFSRLTGSKTLTEADLVPVLDAMGQHLMKKNVAKEIAERICEGVSESLVGKKVGGFQTINSAVRQALSSSITRILTPKTSTDLLLSIRTKLATPLASTQERMPYSIAFVGVNGVGKSTTLSKVCFWLIQNGFRVLIAACDTFRSGAVEQLRVHVRNLGTLVADGRVDGNGSVELFERGYGKDAAGIAKEAISYAKENGFDVVLVDTAGRMQDNEPLMRALAKLAAVNNPDKIIFVGEALVGNEAVDQLSKFDRALKDFSSAAGAGRSRGIDGMLLTKWDTVDDKVGAALSMCYVTGQPIIFVGCGQTYTDLRQLRVPTVVQALLSD